MPWTADPPSEPGWYWVRFTEPALGEVLGVVNVELNGVYLPAIQGFAPYTAECEFHHAPGSPPQPIPEPEETAPDGAGDDE